LSSSDDFEIGSSEAALRQYPIFQLRGRNADRLPQVSHGLLRRVAA
jgi:hypothetical protein